MASQDHFEKKFLTVRQNLTENELDSRRKTLQNCQARQTFNYTLSNLIEKSTNFPIKFPITSVKTETLLKEKKDREKILLDNFKSTYPIMHEDVIPLILDFLEHKRLYGSSIEKKLYESMGISEFINRLFVKRAVQFVGQSDYYQLITGRSGNGGWKKIGTPLEEEPLILENCLSYDEIKISALLGASSPSYFINFGERWNEGIATSGQEEKGVVIGVVGCRFERHEEMEWQEMILSKDQNVKPKGYGDLSQGNLEEKNLLHDSSKIDKSENQQSNRADFFQIWANFYDKPYLPTWEEKKKHVFDDNELEPIRAELFLNRNIYTKRCRMTAEMILLEANERGLNSNKKVFIHVVGFGLGVWQATQSQEKFFLNGFYQAIENIKPSNVSDIYFAWFHENNCNGIGNGEKIGNTETKIWFGKRKPHEKLVGEDEDKLLVVTYAWDGNSLPGNEFWGGCLSSSGDPAQASSSQIAELQNPHINPLMSGWNLRVASPTLKKVVTLQEMVKFISSGD